MRYTSIKAHLKAYSIVAKRTTTINHAFAAAIAPHDAFNEQRVREALQTLGQDPDGEIACAYCGGPAETWDHVHATVAKKEFSGHGHRLGNLLPCCKPCNSKKGNKDWQAYLGQMKLTEADRAERVEVISRYLKKYGVVDAVPEESAEYRELVRLREEVLERFKRADELAGRIRAKSRAMGQK
jgi:5-methylcytosine-specific restriction endonuclease McrA